MLDEQLILVDDRNRRVGTATKRVAHREGLMHRAFSIFLTDDHGRLMMQQRHPAKYHSGGLWANACCGHPRLAEKTIGAAHRRLGEELGLAASLRLCFHARYKAALDNGMHENEFVYVYFGRATGPVKPDPEEVIDIAFMAPQEIRQRMERRPQTFAYWFRHYFHAHYAEIAHYAGPSSVRVRHGSDRLVVMAL